MAVEQTIEQTDIQEGKPPVPKVLKEVGPSQIRRDALDGGRLVRMLPPGRVRVKY